MNENIEEIREENERLKKLALYEKFSKVNLNDVDLPMLNSYIRIYEIINGHVHLAQYDGNDILPETRWNLVKIHAESNGDISHVQIASFVIEIKKEANQWIVDTYYKPKK